MGSARLLRTTLGLLVGMVVAPTAARAREPAPCPTSSCSTWRAEIRAAGTRARLEGAHVYLFPAPPNARARVLRTRLTPAPDAPWLRTAESDADGRVAVDAVPRGPAYLVVVVPGGSRLDAIVEIAQSKSPQRLFVRPDPTAEYRTVVQSDAAPNGNVTSSVMSAEELQTVPGSQGDPLRALQNLPGVGRAPGHLGLLILRGASPQQSRIFAGGHALPRAFHLLSMASVFPTDVLEGLRMVPGNFDAAYGNATGGIVIADLREGRRTGIHGHGEVDIAAASAAIEGPVGPGSFLVAGSRGYVDAVLSATDRVIERVTGEPNSFLLPSYYDYQGRLRIPLSPSTAIGVRAFGSGDRIQSSAQDGGPEGFDFRSGFHRVDVDVVARHRRISFWLTPSFRFEENRFRYAFGESATDQRRRDYVFSYRAELGVRLTDRLMLTAGVDGEVARLRIVTESSELSSVVTPNSTALTQSLIGSWARIEGRWGRWHVVPGVRANAFTVGSQHAFSVDPRLTVRLDVNPTWEVHGGIGRYSQVRVSYDQQQYGLVEGSLGIGLMDALPQVFQGLNPSLQFAPGDTEIGVRQAWHASLGARARFGPGVLVEATAFWRGQDDDTPVFNVAGSTFRGAAHIQTAGLEVLLRKALTRRLYGWIAYTLMWSRMHIRDSIDGYAPYPSDFDQRHNLVVLASYRLPRGFRIGASWRFSTGFPYTPYIGALSTQFGAYPIYGLYNTARLGVFHQLNVRVDKEFILKRVQIRVYFDVQNAYNRVNPEWVRYRPDFRGIDFVMGLPIFPSLGLRLDY